MRIEFVIGVITAVRIAVIAALAQDSASTSYPTEAPSPSPSRVFSTARRREQLPETYKIRDMQAAKKAAEDYFVNHGTDWVRKYRPYRADLIFYTRSPESLGIVLKRGDPIWVVDVVNDAQSNMIQTPIAIVWVRAEDGAVFVVTPKKT